MIQKHKLKIFTAAALALLILLCAPAAPAEQAGESAVNWDMTIQDMMALEGVTEDDGRLSVFKYGEFSQYCLQRTDLDYVGIAAYFFKADRLVMYGINKIGRASCRERVFRTV